MPVRGRRHPRATMATSARTIAIPTWKRLSFPCRWTRAAPGEALAWLRRYGSKLVLRHDQEARAHDELLDPVELPLAGHVFGRSIAPSAERAAAWSSFGHRLKANTHKPIRLSSGTNAMIVHHRLRPDRCKTCAIGTPRTTRSRRNMTGGMIQCQLLGTSSQKLPPGQMVRISIARPRRAGAGGPVGVSQLATASSRPRL